MKRLLNLRRICSAAALAVLFFASSCTKESRGEDTEPPAEEPAYVILSEGRIENLDSLVRKASGDEYERVSLIMELNGVKTLVSEKLTLSGEPLHTVRYSYKSVGPQGRAATVSAYMCYPESIMEGMAADGIILYNHGTYMSNEECGACNDMIESLMSWMNYVFVAADYYGFGSSLGNPQAYLNPEVAARNSIDAYKAAVEILNSKGAACSDRVFNIGYSQGGFNAMCNEKYLSEHPEEELRFTRSFVGGAPFDIPKTFSSFLSGDYNNASVLAAAAVISFNECENLGLPYEALLKEPVLSHYREWYLSMKYSKGDIETLVGSTDIHDILSDGITGMQGSAYEALWQVCNRFTLTQGSWSPLKDSDIRIYHAKTDETVPYINMASMKDYLKSVPDKGAELVFQDIEDIAVPVDIALLLFIAGGGKITHITGAIYFLYDIINSGL